MLNSVNHNGDSVIIAIFAKSNLNNSNMKNLAVYLVALSYEDFRKWFNQNFKLSLDGKFKGLGRVLELMTAYQFEGFISRLARAFQKGTDVFVLHLCGHTFKLYAK